MQVTGSVLKALLIVAASDGIRANLNGIHFQGGLAMATDGHRMLILKTHLPAWFRGFLPREAAEGMCKAAKRTDFALPTRDGDKLGLRLGPVAADLDTDPSLQFDWRRAVPSKVSGEVAQFNPGYIGDFGKVASLLGLRRGCNIAHNGTAAALIDFGSEAEAFGVLMPWRGDASEEPPEWFHAKPDTSGDGETAAEEAQPQTEEEEERIAA